MLQEFTVFDSQTGELLRNLICDEALIVGFLGLGEGVVFGTFDPALAYVRNWEVCFYTVDQVALKRARPKFAQQWSNSTCSWVDNRSTDEILATQKLVAWERIKGVREQLISSPLVTPYGTFDCDQHSRENITRAYLFASKLEQLGQSSEVAFTLADNSRPTFTAAELTQVALAMGVREREAYDTAASLRDLINAAQTLAEVEAIEWPLAS